MIVTLSSMQCEISYVFTQVGNSTYLYEYFLLIFLTWLILSVDVQATVPTYMSAHALVQQISALQSDLLSLQSELENTLPADRKRCINEL